MAELGHRRGLPLADERHEPGFLGLGLHPAAGLETWKVVGTGDFDGDGKADIAWRNASSGEVYVWLMNATTLVSSGSTFVLSDLGWATVPSNPPAGALFRVAPAAADLGAEMTFTVSRRGAPTLRAPHRTFAVAPGQGHRPRRVRPQARQTWTVRRAQPEASGAPASLPPGPQSEAPWSTTALRVGPFPPRRTPLSRILDSDVAEVPPTTGPKPLKGGGTGSQASVRCCHCDETTCPPDGRGGPPQMK